ncbi:beta strand repeat-containing protein [Epilithonimonas caeni]|uniref:beta strand repeat-containing protein n=1 Tax=Epilithonimonas caeni TaxID=365343 RepID=UPI00040CFC7D|nr:Ig-like domain-containing protein [Epilithonimonas caeni]
MKKYTLYYSAFKKNAVQKLLLFLFSFVIMPCCISLSAQQQNSFVLAVPGQNLNFLNANRTLITNMGNNGLSAGSVWRYDNLITTNGITIYGILTIKEINGTGTTLTMLDDETAGTGLPGRFQPRITTPATGGNILFELEFYEVTTNNRAYISEYYFTAADIDGSEFVEIGGYSTYQIDATSGLTITQQSTGRTRFGGITTELDGINFENTAAFIAQYKFPYTKVTFALGKSNAGTSRQFSLQFGTAGGTFTNPTTVRNPVKLMYITKKADTDNFVGGTTRKYTVVLDNIGATAENVTLTDPLPAGLTYVPNTTTISVPAVSEAESVADNFNSVSYARNNGIAWWKNEWTEIGEATDPAAGQITITSNALRFVTLPNGRGIERTVNLLRATNATLSFAYTQSATNGTLDVQVSSNGSTYVSIGSISGNTSGTFTGTIGAAYLTADTRIRLVNSSGGTWGTKTTTVDDLTVQYTLSLATQNKTNAASGGTLLNGVPSNVIVSGDNITLLPGAKATITFDVNVNCNAQGTITNTATAAAPGLYEDSISASHTGYVDPVNVTGSSRCDAGTEILTASGAQGNQQYRWYAASSGGTPLATGASFTTPSISSTTTYYVSFYSPDTGCESGRTPVTAVVSSAGAITGTGVISTTTGANGTTGDTGTVAAPNTAANNNASGTTAWTNLTNITSSNNANTSATNIAANGGTSQYLEIPFPTISIPTGYSANSISGIAVGIERNANNTNSIRDNVIQLLKNNIAVGDNKANTGTFWPNSDATVTYGGDTDLWGTTWQASDFTNTKLRIQVYNNATATRTANIDYVYVRVYFGAFGDDQSSVSFKISGISGATGYTWTVPNGATITSGQGSDTILVNFNNAGQSGTYNVCATPSNTCGNGTQVCRQIAITNNVNNEISGTVYNDQNGAVSPEKVDGTPISQIGGQQLYAILTQSATTGTPAANRAISSVTVDPAGTYKFSYLANTTANYYRVYIKTTPYGDGIAVPAASDLPAGAVFNGAIDNDSTNSLTGGNSNLGYLNVTAGNNTNNTNVNFGIAVSNPIGNPDVTSTLEDTAKTFNILTNDTATSGTLNGATVDLDPTTAGRQTTYTTANGTWIVDDIGNVTFTPVPDYFGNDSINYTVENSLGYKSNPTSITITVDPVNDAPSFTKGADQVNSQTSSATPYTVAGWATNISKGPANESLQSVSFIVTNNNNALFSVQPTITALGQLQYTIAGNASGTALVSVRIQDDGGTANGGVDTSAVQTFTITVNPGYCYKPAVTDAGNNIPSQHGVTALSRAGANGDNWPMVRQSAWTVLESKEKGFVINRIPTTASLANITNPIIGMMVYDVEAKCIKIYAVKSGETNPSWSCFETQACPD